MIDLATLLLGVALAALTQHDTPLRALAAPYVGGGETDAACAYVGAPCDSPGPITTAEVVHVMHDIAARESEYRPDRRTDHAVAEAIVIASAEAGVEWIDLVVIGWHESRWTPDAIAPDGCACGAWQVRSSRCIATRPPCEQLHAPLFGARYAAGLLRACCGLTSCYAAGATGQSRPWAQEYARRHARVVEEMR